MCVYQVKNNYEIIIMYKLHEETVRMWRFRKPNGITEGFQRKMQT